MNRILYFIISIISILLFLLLFLLIYKIYLCNKADSYLDSIDIIYWINLERSIDRKKNMIELMNILNIKNIRINAIDGKNLNDNILNKLYISKSYDRTIYEYACLASHLNTIKTFAKSSNKIALICEDDINLDYKNYWDLKISEIIKNAPEDWDIIMLGYTTEKELVDLYTLINKNNKIYGTISYIINKKAANKLINSIYIDNKFLLIDDYSHTADGYIFNLLKTYVYRYPYFTYPDDNDSTIHNDHLNLHMLSKHITNKLWIKKI